MDLRQGAWWTKSTSLSSGMVYEHRVHARVAGEEESSVSSPACFPPVMCSPVSSCNDSGVQLWWEKAFPCHGNCNGGVRATDRAS